MGLCKAWTMPAMDQSSDGPEGGPNHSHARFPQAFKRKAGRAFDAVSLESANGWGADRRGCGLQTHTQLSPAYRLPQADIITMISLITGAGGITQETPGLKSRIGSYGNRDVFLRTVGVAKRFHSTGIPGPRNLDDCGVMRYPKSGESGSLPTTETRLRLTPFRAMKTERIR